MVSKEEATQLIEQHLPKTAHITSVTDYSGHYIYAINDPNDQFDNFKAVDKKTGEITRYNPWEDDAERFISEVLRQNSK